MLHAYLLPITLCFTCASWCFYGFSATNILTRCRSASFCFLLFFISEKLQRKYSRNRQRKLFYEVVHRKTPEARRRARGGPQGGHTPWARVPPPPLGAPGVVWAPWPASGSALSPIRTPRRKNPKDKPESSRKVPPPSSHRSQVSGDRSLCSGTLPGRGSAPERISIDSTAISIAVADSYDEE